MRNMVSRYEYVNIKHRKDGSYMKMVTYLGIRLLAETIYLRIKHIRFILLQDIKLFFLYVDLIMRIANFFSLSCALLCSTSNCSMLRITRWNEYKLMSRSPWPRVLGLGMRSLTCVDCGFESHRGRGCISFVIVVCC